MNSTRALIREFAGEKNFVVAPVTYIRFTGSLEAGILLNQMIYWADRTNDTEGWFYKSYTEWAEEIFLPEKTIRKIAKDFMSKKFLQCKVKKNYAGNPTVHYLFLWDVFAAQFEAFCRKRSGENKEEVSKPLSTPFRQNGGKETANLPKRNSNFSVTYNIETEITSKDYTQRSCARAEKEIKPIIQLDMENDSVGEEKVIQPRLLVEQVNGGLDGQEIPQLGDIYPQTNYESEIKENLARIKKSLSSQEKSAVVEDIYYSDLKGNASLATESRFNITKYGLTEFFEEYSRAERGFINSLRGTWLLKNFQSVGIELKYWKNFVIFYFKQHYENTSAWQNSKYNNTPEMVFTATSQAIANKLEEGNEAFVLGLILDFKKSLKRVLLTDETKPIVPSEIVSRQPLTREEILARAERLAFIANKHKENLKASSR